MGKPASGYGPQPPHGVAEPIGQPTYAIVNVMARYNLTDALSLQANVDNPFDKRFFSGNVWFPGFVYVEPGNARLILKYAL